MESNIHVGISYMYEPGFNRALLPLLEAGMVDALEWSFDTVADHRTLPDWMLSLLKAYADEGRLYGHGVYYSMFSGKWFDRHTQWMMQLERVLADFRFRHISEHFGFMTSGNAHEGAPLPVPFCDACLQLAQNRLQQLHHTVRMPVGIENLAFSFFQYDLQQQGPFLEQIIAPVDGFILLDLHNIYCQSANFGISALELVKTYPLHLVKEIHVSGGSWEHSPYAQQPIRRDTHNEAIPEEVFELLNDTLPLCPHLELVIVERLGDTFADEQDDAQFQDEFLRIRQLVKSHSLTNISFWDNRDTPLRPTIGNNVEDLFLQTQQTSILAILEHAIDPEKAKDALLASTQIDQQLWGIAQWRLPMIETAIALGKKWGIDSRAGLI